MPARKRTIEPLFSMTLEVLPFDGETLNKVMLNGEHVGYAYMTSRGHKLAIGGRITNKGIDIVIPGEGDVDGLAHMHQQGRGRNATWYLTVPGVDGAFTTEILTDPDSPAWRDTGHVKAVKTPEKPQRTQQVATAIDAPNVSASDLAEFEEFIRFKAMKAAATDNK